jgi:hypothetical protein
MKELKYKIRYVKKGEKKETLFENAKIVGEYSSNDWGTMGLKIFCPLRGDYRNLNYEGIISAEVTL